jgi:hypothetical protein
MIKNHSKISAVLLIGLFLYSSFGFLLIYFPAKTIIRYTVSKAIKYKEIKKEDLSNLSFNLYDLSAGNYDFVWKKPGKEFQFEGKMYDIEAKRIDGDSIHYTVYYDHKESLLEELFVIHSRNQDNDKNKNVVQRVILLGLFIETDIVYTTKDLSDLTSLPLQKNEASKINFYKDVPTPPPRYIV